MKKVTIKNLAGVHTHGANFEDPTAWIAECVASNAWGLPERPELDAEGNPTGVILPAEYTISIIDLEQDSTWLLQQCHEKRLMEYPPLGEFADAYVKLQQGDSSQMEAYVLKCIEVKNKYPKP